MLLKKKLKSMRRLKHGRLKSKN